MTPDTSLNGPVLRYDPQTTTAEEKLQLLELASTVPENERHSFFAERNLSPAVIGMWSQSTTLEKIEAKAGRLCRIAVPGRSSTDIERISTLIRSQTIPSMGSDHHGPPNGNGNGHSTKPVFQATSPGPASSVATTPLKEELPRLSEEERRELEDLMPLVKPLIQIPDFVEMVARQRIVRVAYLLQKASDGRYAPWCRQMNVADALEVWTTLVDGSASVTKPPTPPRSALSEKVDADAGRAAAFSRPSKPRAAHPAAVSGQKKTGPATSYNVSSGPAPSWLVTSVPERIPDTEAEEQELADAEGVLRKIGLVIGNDPGMQEVWQKVRRAAKSEAHMLLLGESGTGKELFFEATHCIHNEKGPVRRLNCPGISPNLIESELFGHKKGSFTNAITDRIDGAFQIVADGGTLFLDEIGDLPMEQQAKLLRVLENGEFSPVGTSTMTTLKNTKIVAATNQNLHQLVQEGRFRLDLLYRISGNTIMVPPLAKRTPEHRQDLIGLFLQKLSLSSHQETYMTPEALALFQAEHYEGNVRQLRDHVRRARDEAALHQRGTLYITGEHVEKTRESKEETSSRDWKTDADRGEFFGGALQMDMDMLDPTTLRTEIDVTHIRQNSPNIVRAMEMRIAQLAYVNSGFNQSKTALLLGFTREKLRVLLADAREIFGEVDPHKKYGTPDEDEAEEGEAQSQ